MLVCLANFDDIDDFSFVVGESLNRLQFYV